MPHQDGLIHQRWRKTHEPQFRFWSLEITGIYSERYELWVSLSDSSSKRDIKLSIFIHRYTTFEKLFHNTYPVNTSIHWNWSWAFGCTSFSAMFYSLACLLSNASLAFLRFSPELEMVLFFRVISLQKSLLSNTKYSFGNSFTLEWAVAPLGSVGSWLIAFLDSSRLQTLNLPLPTNIWLCWVLQSVKKWRQLSSTISSLT